MLAFRRLESALKELHSTRENSLVDVQLERAEFDYLADPVTEVIIWRNSSEQVIMAAADVPELAQLLTGLGSAT
jgi:hypothetical protein